MTSNQYEVFAIKYAELGREARANFVDGDSHDLADMPLDYFVWVVRNDQRTVIVDTGFSEAIATTGITVQEQKGLNAPTAVARRMASAGCAAKARLM